MGSGEENTPPDQNSAGSYGAEGNLGNNMHIKTEQSDSLTSSCGRSACLNEEERLGQWPGPKNGVNKNIIPLIRLGAKRRLIERELISSKVKAVSLAAPSMCMQVDVRK